ncbi:HET-R [Cladorrhinum samala]|uniref:WD40 repeat-containing protein SMU1 n=1 Tax=Cladorrhinum samala TaxID=585594 RepID=A0AAV9HM97_9PEZI|nr:HET-R [Cladorrhinum samala]
MRLLERDDTGEFRLTDDYLPNSGIPPYAILSHRWGDAEVLFGDFMNGTAKNKAGYAKIRFCGDQAWRDGLKFFWVDTCCIDKSNSTELQEAINSMFRWYRDATKCYAYLGDVSVSTYNLDDKSIWESAFRASSWFTRGWTLQELVAPTSVEFFSREGVYLGNRSTLEQIIHDVTEISAKAIQGGRLSDFSVHERMAWIEKRKTTREEDRAYSLFGIFDVQLPLLYGEGELKAFRRLWEEINKSSNTKPTMDEADIRCLSDLRITDPRHDKKRIEDAKGGLLEGAYGWVLTNAQYKQWLDRSDSRLLWIKGDPGKGKTMLLCGIIDELRMSAPSSFLSFFFCQATNTDVNNASAALRGLIYQLVSQQPTLISHVRQHYDVGGKRAFEDTNGWIILRDIFTAILQNPGLRMTYLIIDALDECVTDLPRLLNLIAEMSPASRRVKWIVSSRNWPQIEEKLAMAAQSDRLSLELNAESVATAVNTYIDHRVSQLSRLKQYDNETQTIVRNCLSSKADGTFLWVALVCQALADPDVQEWHTLEVLYSFPPGLDDLYLRMVRHIRKSKDNLHCKRILAAVSVVQRPISIRELATLVELPDSITRYRERLEKLIVICGSFLALREQSIYFVHQSAKDFLLGKADLETSREAYQEASGWVFPQGPEDVHHLIFSRSLNAMSAILRRDIYDLKAPGFPIDKVQTPTSDPLATVRYSCVFWVVHLRSSISDKDMLQCNNTLDAVQTFLEKKYLYWLEALSLLQAMSEGIIAIRQLAALLGRTNQRALKNFVQDAHRFALSYRWIVEQAPLQAYTSALVFAPTGSLVKRNFRTDQPDWISTKPVVEADWNACLQTLEGHGNTVRSVAFSPDGQRLASGSDDNTVKIWDPASGQCLQTLEDHNGPVESVAFSPDGQRLASGSEDNTVKIWDPASGQCLQTLEDHNGLVESVAFSPDGQRLASGSFDNTVKIWDPASGQCLQTFEGHNESVISVAFSPDSQQLASGSEDDTVKIWDPASGQCLQTLEDHNGPVRSVAFSPDGQRLASGSFDNTVKIWDPISRQCLQTLKGHGDIVWSVAFSPDSQRLASGSEDNTVKIWDPAAGGQYLQTLKGHNGPVESVTFSPDGQRLASGSFDNTVKIWDPASGQCSQTFEGHNESVISVAFSPDSQWLASCSFDDTIKIWDPISAQCLQTLKGHSGSVCLVAFSPDSQQLASGSFDATVKIWDLISGQCLQTLRSHGRLIRSAAFSPDGQRLATGSSDETVKIWDPASGQCLQTFNGHNDSVLSVAFSPDGGRLASGSYDNTVKIWDLASGQCLGTRNVPMTDTGDIDKIIDMTERAFQPDDLVKSGYSLGQDKSWITCNSKNALWLPPEYRPDCFTIQGQTISIGCSSGQVLTISFSRDI